MVRLGGGIPMLACLVAALVAAPPRAGAEEVDPDDAGIEAAFEVVSGPPYEQEMVLLKLRGHYAVPITLEVLDQPALADFGWMQLGRDRWFSTTVSGRQMRGYERTMALFPKKAGRLTVEPFQHRLTIMGRDGVRFQHTASTQAVSIDVAPKPAAQGWWLPARSIKVSDQWDRPPDRLPPGETALRTVMLEAEGVSAELLPPVPTLRSPGVVAFPEPEERVMRLTPQGPVSTVRWRWRVRSMTTEPAVLQPVRIPWFDTGARQARVLELAPARIAPAIAAAEAGPQEPGPMVRAAVPLGLALGFAGGAALLLPGLRFRSRRELAGRLARWLPDPDALALRIAAWRGDAPRFRQAARRYLALRGVTPAGDAAAGLAALDRMLFGRAGGGVVPLRPIARAVLRAGRGRHRQDAGGARGPA
ncbi:hypothetical protein [Prosthecomicrobium sp. N25]|uniref:hypothetical protein n=1 Tax=Prosthecomicrobium sp. N25 TaxID=3129254 RepID=UPI00307824CB